MTRGNIVNLVCFQVGWVCAVVGAARGYPWLGPLVAVPWLTWHLASQGEARAVELKLLLTAAVVGYVADSALVLVNVMEFPIIAQLGWPSTVWMVSLWVMFAATLRHSMAWLRGRTWLAVLLGAICGPLAYWAGARLGALHLADPVVSGLAISLEWVVALPLLLAAERRFEAGAPPGPVPRKV